MPRIRSIHPSLHRDKTLSTVSATAERTFVRLWCHLDDEGRGEDDPELLKSDLYPRHSHITAEDLERDLQELADRGLIIRYVVDGEPYLCCKPATWADYQRPQKKQESKLPGPEQADTDTEPLRDRSDTATRPVPPVGEGRGEGEGNPMSVPDDTDDGFEDFWNTYPRHHDTKALGGGGVKKTAKNAWRRLSKAEREEATAALDTYAKVCRPDGQKPKHAERFLRNDAWKPYLPDARDGPKTNLCRQCDRQLDSPDHDELCDIFSGRQLV